MSEETEIKLTGKQKLFVDYYVGEARHNATKAAKLAGYSEKGAQQIGSENLSKLVIAAAIDERLRGLTLSANTVLARLTEIANGKVTDFLDDDKNFDLKKAKNNRKDHLLKKVKIKRTLKQKKTEVNENMRSFLADDEIEDIESETEIIYEEVEFEMYSSHEALRDLGKYHKLFTDRAEIEASLRHSVDDETVKKLNQAYERIGNHK